MSQRKMYDRIYLHVMIRDLIQAVCKRNDPLFSKYVSFNMQFKDQYLVSKSADYLPDTKTVRLFCIREHTREETTYALIGQIAAHIDSATRGFTRKDFEYYKVYFPLLQYALDYGYLKKSDLEAIPRRTLKEQEMVSDYVLTPKEKSLILAVFNSYSYKEILRSQHFRWDPTARCWYYAACRRKVERKKEILSDCGIKLSGEDGVSFKEIPCRIPNYKEFLPKYRIVIMGTPKADKKELREFGFHYDALKKVWFYESICPREDMRRILGTFPKLRIDVDAG